MAGGPARVVVVAVHRAERGHREAPERARMRLAGQLSNRHRAKAQVHTLDPDSDEHLRQFLYQQHRRYEQQLQR